MKYPVVEWRSRLPLMLEHRKSDRTSHTLLIMYVKTFGAKCAIIKDDLPTTFQYIWHRCSEEKIFRNWPIRNKNCLWQPCLLMDRYKMDNLHREPSIDPSYQVLVHLVKRFQRRIIFNWPTRNKNCLWQWQPCLLMDRDKISHGCFHLQYIKLSHILDVRFFLHKPSTYKFCLIFINSFKENGLQLNQKIFDMLFLKEK